MIERERWIVYPLLFLVLGLTLKDKIAPPDVLDAARIDCVDLKTVQVTLTDESGRTQARLRAVPGKNSAASPVAATGEIELLDANGRLRALLGPRIQAERIESQGLVEAKAMVVVDSAHRPRVEIGAVVARSGNGMPSKESAGAIQILGQDDKPVVFIGSHDLGKTGSVEVGAGGGPLAIVSSSPEGGVLLARHGERQAAISLGYFPEGSGVVTQAGPNLLWLGQLSQAEIAKLPKLAPREKRAPADKPTEKRAPDDASKKKETKKQEESTPLKGTEANGAAAGENAKAKADEKSSVSPR